MAPRRKDAGRRRTDVTRARVKRVVGAGFLAAALLSAALVAASLSGSRDSSEEPTAAVAATVGAGGVDELLRDIPQDGIALGSPDAPVTLVEYADLQCPYCAAWALESFPEIVDQYVRPGHVRLVFRGLAFLGPDSDTALRTTLAAGAQDKLWNVLHLLYRSQGAENAGWVTDRLLGEVTGSVQGLDGDRVLAERESALVERQLVAAQQAGAQAGIAGTPSFEAGPTGGRLQPLEIHSLDAAELGAHLDQLLAR